MEAIIAQALGAFLPALIEYLQRRAIDGASHDVALMQAIAKLEDERAKAKFPNYQPPSGP